MMNLKLLIGSVAVCALALVAKPGNAAVTFGVDPSANWIGWMNWSDPNGANPTGSAWGTADLSASFTGNVATLTPNTSLDRDKPSDPYWWQPSGAANKLLEANYYFEGTAGAAGEDLTFTGDVLSNTLVSPYAAQAFIKEFTPDWGWIGMTTAPLTPGEFTINRQTSGAGNHLQFGFMVTGPNARLADVSRLGSVQITAAGTSPIPEPSTLALLASSAAGLLAFRRRNRS